MVHHPAPPPLVHASLSAPAVPQLSGRPRAHSHSRSYSYPAPVPVNVMAAAPPPPYARAIKTPGPGHYAGGYVFAPYQQYHAPQPNVAPQPQGYGYFSWPSTSTVDELEEEEIVKDSKKRNGDHGIERSKTPAPSIRSHKKATLFGSLRRKMGGPEVHLHMLLLHARPAPLAWDVRNSPSSASRGSSPAPNLILGPHDRAQFATSPPRSFIRITCDLMPWSLDILCSPDTAGITVGQVLEELHAFLQRRVRRSEWLIAGDGQQEKVVRAFAWRCYNSPGPRGFEEQQGPKRVDWLLKRTVFRGLGHGSDEDTFTLHLGQH